MNKSRLSTVEKLIYFFNFIIAILLVCAYLLPFIPPRFSSTLSILNLGLPLLFVLNLLFTVFWLVKLKKQMILSIIAVLCGFLYFDSIFKFNAKTSMDEVGSLDLMSYNVRLFDRYHWAKESEITAKIKKFIAQKDPDIVTFQDYFISDTTQLDGYDYSYVVASKKEVNTELGFSVKRKSSIRKT